MVLRASLVAQQIGSLGWEAPLVKEMTTRSSILAWRNSMVKGPGGLQSLCSHKKQDTNERLTTTKSYRAIMQNKGYCIFLNKCLTYVLRE